MPEPGAVRSMFARIAGRYDLLNRTLSGGTDQRWRRRALKALGSVDGAAALDVACGTGDLAVHLARAGARVVGADFTYEMVALAPAKARRKGLGVAWIQGDALALPAADASYDVLTIAFGLRNVADRVRALEEFARVLRPGGRLCVLEFGMPRGRLFGAAYRTYFTRVLPRVGGLVSGDRAAYEYLPATVLEWPGPDQLAAECAATGFEACRYEPLMDGVAYLHLGVRAGD